MSEKLPPLPPGTRQGFFGVFYTPAEVEAIRRQTVEHCAKVCDAEAKHCAEMARLDNDSRYDHMEQAALDCAGEIRDLLETPHG